MYYIGVNKSTRIADFMLYSDRELTGDSQYIYFNLENPSDYLWRKYENGEWSEEKFPPPEPEPEITFSMEDYILDLEFRISMIEMGGM